MTSYGFIELGQNSDSKKLAYFQSFEMICNVSACHLQVETSNMILNLIPK